jgi:DNA-binding transcriptional MerR regulator
VTRPAVAAQASFPDMNQLDATEADDQWRIDELARRSGATVDTIRFYQRDGLLPPTRREGRAALYGPAHLRRIEQIRDLQGRHFNLGAVKALLIDNRIDVIHAIFAADDLALTRDELVKVAGIDDAVVGRIEDVGLLADPAESGRTGYDQADVDVLVTIREMVSLGLPEDVVLFLARMYAEAFSVMQTRVSALFNGEGELDWPDPERAAFIAGLGSDVAKLIPLTTQLLNSAHQAAVRRITVTTWVGGEVGDEEA